jgi:hypothetical protein
MTPDMEKLVGELGGLWRAYAGAFQTGDMDSVLPIFAEPCVVHTRLSTSLYLKRADIGANNNRLLAFYRSQGVVRAEATILEVDPVHRHFVQLFVRYRLLDGAGEDVVSFTTVYGLKQDGERWVVHQVIAQDEIEAWTARGTPLG